MKKILLMLLIALTLATAGCSPDNGSQQLETARFEEKQNNKEHAIKLYEEIVKKYPGSANAKIAQERLLVLKGSR